MLYTKKTFPFEYDLKEADVALLGIPFDSTHIVNSVKYGPLFIREALNNIPFYDTDLKLNVFEKCKFCDLGDIEVVPGSWKLTEERIAETIKEMFHTNPKVLPVFLGGEHLITLGILEALGKVLNRKIMIIDFDAHTDLMDDWLGERYSQITWAKRILENKNFEMIQTGTRSWEKEEEKAIEKLKKEGRLLEIRDFESIRKLKIKNPVYLTIDLDIFDPAHAPEVGAPEPLGMEPEEFFRLLREACRNKIIGFDIVECASDRINTRTALIAAQVIKKILGYNLSQPKNLHI